MIIRSILTIIFLLAGLVFVTAATVGVLKMDNLLSRLHVSGVGGTFGLLLISFGLLLYEGLTFTGIKILIIFFVMLVANPIGTHILAKVAYEQSEAVLDAVSAEGDVELAEDKREKEEK